MRPETRKALLEARVAYHRAEAAAAEEELQELARVVDGHERRWDDFDPDWKRGIRLSRKGEEAVLRAYDDHLRQAQVAELFRISERAAHDWHKRWKATRGR